MRFATLQTVHGPRAGIIVDQTQVLLLDQHASVQEIIDAGPEALRSLQAYTTHASPTSFEYKDLLAPLPQPRKNIFCVGMNYAEHARESLIAKGLEPVLPEHPVFFTKPPTAVNRPGGSIEIDPRVSVKIDWEAELGVVIGKRGRNITREQAAEYVWGYTVINDVSARDLQKRHGQFFKGKSLDGSCPMGPWIVTADEIADPHQLTVQLHVNGTLKQNASTNDLIFDIWTLIEVLSLGMTLEPGDILATGTPAGVGFARTPAEYLQPGDLLETEIEGIGVLRNPVVAATPA